MEIKDKKINILGDSITAGGGASAPMYNYVNVFRNLSGADVESYGVGGTRIAKQIHPELSAEAVYNRYFASRISDMRKEADIVVVFGGTNDFGHGDAPMGSFENDDPDTFYGALRDLYGKLYETYPTARIIVITPLHRVGEDEPLNEVGKPCRPLREYVTAIKAVAEEYSLPILDLWSSGNLTTKVERFEKMYFCDGLHPSDLGHKRIAESLYQFLLNL